MGEIVSVGGVDNLQVKNEHCVEGYTLIDVRGEDEFTGELGHISGAKLVTLGPDLQEFFETAPKDDNYLFICRSGGRSNQACLLAKSKGFEKATNLAGGMFHWNDLALKTEK